MPATLIAALVALTTVALWQTHDVHSAARAMSVLRQPDRVMGTTCQLIAVMPADSADRAESALDAAEGALRHIESLCSTYIEQSELSKFNHNQASRVGPETAAIVREAYDGWRKTDGAFDVSARPQFELWKRCGKEGRLPTPDEIADAQAMSNWQLIAWDHDEPRKLKPTVEFDLGGIAKGYAIDRAIEAMKTVGAMGGLVDVGGDVRCFGPPPPEASERLPHHSVGGGWPVALRNPFGRNMLFTLRLTDKSVCTSGNYARFVEIGGKRYSHIVDPRSGMPADHVPSVTVIAPDATTADVWATALSVLGADGLQKLPAGVEAMVVTGTVEGYEVETTAGFKAYMKPEARNQKPE